MVNITNVDEIGQRVSADDVLRKVLDLRGGDASQLPNKSADFDSSYDKYNGGWNSDVPIANDRGEYSGAPRYIQPGQYGNGMLADVVASYGGFGTDDKLEFLSDPSSVVSDSARASTTEVSLDDILPPIKTETEMQEVGFEDEAKNRKFLDLAASSIGEAKNGFDLLREISGSQLGKLGKSVLAASGFGQAGLALVSAFLPFLDKQFAYVGAGTDNAEKSQALSGNISGFGAYAQTGTETMNNQADLMEKMADKLSTNDDGTFKDAEYAYKAVNQMSLLSNNGPVFLSKGHVALPEMTTGNNQTSLPLPGNVFSYGAGTDNSGRRDRSHALVNNSSDSTAAFDNLETVDGAFKRGKEIANEWKDSAQDASGSSTQADKLTARETGPTKMLDKFYGQSADLKTAQERFEAARVKLTSKMEHALDSSNWDALAKEASSAIRSNYADQQNISSSNLVQPVEIGLNPKLSKDASEISTDASKLFNNLGQRASESFDKLYSTKDGSLLSDAKQQLTETWLTSGKEISPFNDRLAGYMKDIEKERNDSMNSNGTYPGTAKLKESLRKKLADDPLIGKGTMDNILKDGLSLHLNGEPPNGGKHADASTQQYTEMKLSKDKDGKFDIDKMVDTLIIEGPNLRKTTFTLADQSRGDREFLEANRDALNLIKDKWDTWNGKDDIVSKKDLTKIADPSKGYAENEQKAAQLLLENGLADKLDTFGEAGKGDSKISTQDFNEWFYALTEGQSTVRSSERT